MVVIKQRNIIEIMFTSFLHILMARTHTRQLIPSSFFVLFLFNYCCSASNMPAAFLTDISLVYSLLVFIAFFLFWFVLYFWFSRNEQYKRPQHIIFNENSKQNSVK